MSRYDQPTNEPDYDRYETRPVEDIDVPDFDQPDPPVDPAEHAAHALIDALETLERELTNAKTFERVMAIWKMVRDIENHAAEAVNLAAKRADEIIERRR
jgi:hypothetical protein